MKKDAEIVKSQKLDSETGIWSLETAKRKHRTDYVLAAGIAHVWSYKLKTVPRLTADLGCGPGWYCRILKACGFHIVHGYEGTPDIKKIAVYNDVTVFDLTKLRTIGIPYDLVICLEVAEHIPEKYEQVFIHNVCNFASKDLIISWAKPGQGGTGHFNEKSKEYVIDEFMKRGFMIHKKATEMVSFFATNGYLKRNIIVFTRN